MDGWRGGVSLGIRRLAKVRKGGGETLGEGPRKSGGGFEVMEGAGG